MAKSSSGASSSSSSSTATTELIPNRAKTLKDSTESTSDRTIYKIINKPFNRSDTETLSNYPDIEIIRRDENAVGKSIPHDIPADIELIPMSSENSSMFGKRAAKRTFSPDNTTSKQSKLNDHSGSMSVSNELSKVSNTITMSPINFKMFCDAQQQQQQQVLHSICYHHIFRQIFLKN